MVTEIREVHCENAYSPRVVTLSGMIIEVKPLSENASVPIEVTLLGKAKTTVVREVQSANAQFPRVVTLSGMIMEVRE